MKKIDLTLDDETFTQRLEELRQHEKIQVAYKPMGQSVHYDELKNLVVIELNNGLIVSFSPDLGQETILLNPKELSKVCLTATGDAIRWSEKGIGMEIGDILRGCFGSKKWMNRLVQEQRISSNQYPNDKEVRTAWGKIGGSIRSLAKIRAARENGKKGGRPRKSSSTPSEL